MTPQELLLAEVRLAHRAMLAHATAVADARFGVAGVRRRRLLRFAAPSRNYEVDRSGQWGCCIPEDAPIWAPCRKGTRVWRVGEEVRDE